MPKKIALFVLGLMLAVGAFLLYQYISGQHTGVPVVAKPPPATAPIEILPATFEERDEQGRLVYLIRAAKSPEPILDANKNPIPGQYSMSQPEATFYRVGGRIIRINADSCQVVFDQSPRLGAGSGGKLKDQINLRTGQLEGHVRIYISGQQTPVTTTGPASAPATAPSKDPFPHGVRLYVDGPVVYDRTQGQLIARDGVHIRSDTASFDGSGLTLAVNQQAQRIDFLRIEKGKEILMRHVGDRFLPTTAATAPASAPAPVASTKPAKPQTIYRLTLSQDVHAKAGERSLDAQSLNVLFATSEELSGIKAATNPAGGVASTASPEEPAIPDMPLEPEPIAAAEANDLHITWSGPLELRPTENLNVKLGEGDAILEAFGTAQKPVSIVDGDRSAKAGHLWYHHDEQRVELEPGDFLHVLLGDSKGMVDCPSASILLDEKPNVVFNGPGTLVLRNKTNPDKLAANVTWKTHLHVDLQKTADEKDPAKSTFVPRHAVLDGATIKSPDFDLAADVLDALLDVKSAQPLQHLLATGHVAVTSFHKEDGTEQGGLKTDAMEIVTAAGPTGPVPSQLIATGNVSGWRFIDRSKEADALGAASKPATRAAGRVAPAIEKDAITAGKLIADLQPRAKSDTQPAATKPAGDALSPMGDFDPVHLVAENDVRVEITPPAGTKRPPVVALAARLEAMPLKGTATLTAADGKTTPVRVAMGDNTIETRLIQLDNQAKTFAAPGAGVFNFVRPADEKNKKATPMQVSWEKSMSYDDVKHLAVFTGSPIARTPGAQSNLGWVRSDDTLTVKLTRGASDTSPVDAAKMPVEWIEAVGNVHASGAQIDESGKKLTDLQFTALDDPGKPGKLRYVEATKSFEIPGPGALAIDIDRPVKAGTGSDDVANANGQSVFGWKGSLAFDGDKGIVTFKRDVDYIFTPKNGFKFIKNTGKETEPDRARLHTDLLTAQFAPPDPTKSVKSPIGLQIGDLTSVLATEGANMEVGGYRVNGGSLSFEPGKHTALILPGPDDGDRVVVERIGTEQRGTAARVVMDMTKDKVNFVADRPQGNLAGFGLPK